jgi:hypothetical protein
VSRVLFTGMADFFFRSRPANVGHAARFLCPACFTGTEGPWQYLDFTTPNRTCTYKILNPRGAAHPPDSTPISPPPPAIHPNLRTIQPKTWLPKTGTRATPRVI